MCRDEDSQVKTNDSTLIATVMGVIGGIIVVIIFFCIITRFYKLRHTSNSVNDSLERLPRHLRSVDPESNQPQSMSKIITVLPVNTTPSSVSSGSAPAAVVSDSAHGLAFQKTGNQVVLSKDLFVLMVIGEEAKPVIGGKHTWENGATGATLYGTAPQTKKGKITPHFQNGKPDRYTLSDEPIQMVIANKVVKFVPQSPNSGATSTQV